MERAIKFLDRVSGGKDGGSYGYTDSQEKVTPEKPLNAVGFFCSQILGVHRIPKKLLSRQILLMLRASSRIFITFTMEHWLLTNIRDQFGKNG